MNNNNNINMSSFFEDLSGHYDRFDRGHDFLRSKLLSDLKPYGHVSGGSVANELRSGTRMISLASYLSRIAAVAAIVIFAFGFAVFNIGNNSNGLSVAHADSSILQKVTEFNNVHFKMTVLDSKLEMWWQKPNTYRMQFGDGTIITNSNAGYSCLSAKTGEISVKPALETAGPEMFLLSELGEVFPFDHSPSQQLVKNSEIISTKNIVYKGEECYKITSRNKLTNDTFEYVIDKDQPMIYEIKRISNGKVISHVEVLEIDATMDEKLFRLN